MITGNGRSSPIARSEVAAEVGSGSRDGANGATATRVDISVAPPPTCLDRLDAAVARLLLPATPPDGLHRGVSARAARLSAHEQACMRRVRTLLLASACFVVLVRQRNILSEHGTILLQQLLAATKHASEKHKSLKNAS